MNKTLRAIFLITLILMINVRCFAESKSEGVVLVDADRVQQNSSFADNMEVRFTDDVTTVGRGELLKVGVEITSVNGLGIGQACWVLNGERLNDYRNTNFEVFNGKKSEFEICPEFGDHDSVTIGFEVEVGEKKVSINKVIKLKEPPQSYQEAVNPALDNEYSQVAKVFNLIKPVDIEATVLADTNTYSDKSLKTVKGKLSAGDNAIYVDHSDEYSACLWLSDGTSCWVPYNKIRVSDKNYTVFEDFSTEDKEVFVNAKGYTSDMDYLVWVNLERQKVNVFLKKNGKWKLTKSMPCATGKNITPTPTGEYIYTKKISGWFNPEYVVKPVLYISEPRAIAFHSRTYNPNGTIQDSRMGTPISHGCIRMFDEDIRWMADYVRIGSKVVVF